MDDGGFDVVIGNPPYVRVDSLIKDDKDYWKDTFATAYGKYDLYYLFFELAMRLLKPNGILAFITPNRFCTNSTGERLRERLLAKGRVVITSLSRLPVFDDAANYPVVTIVYGCGNSGTITFNDINHPQELFALQPKYELRKLDTQALPRSIFPINVTSKELMLALSILNAHPQAQQDLTINEGLRIPPAWESMNATETPIVKQYQFSRYSPIKGASYIAKEHYTKMNTQAKRVMNCSKPKIVFAEDALKVEATIDLQKSICQGGVYYATLNNHDRSINYYLGILNSTLITFIFKALYSGIHMGGGYLRFRSQYLQELPIRRIDFNNPTETAIHNNLAALVQKMLDLNEQLTPIINEFSHKRDALLKEIEKTDKEIDNMVYELYGLTEEERLLVEGEDRA